MHIPNIAARLAWFLFLVALASHAAAARPAFCYIDHVTRLGQDVSLHFVPDSNVFVRIMKSGQGISPADRMYQETGGRAHRIYPNETRPETAAAEIILSRGEEAFVGGDPHGRCTIRIASEGQNLGVTMEVAVGLPGLPPQTTVQFLPAIPLESGHP